MKLKDKTGLQRNAQLTADSKLYPQIPQVPSIPLPRRAPNGRRWRHSAGWSGWGSQAESEPTGNSASAPVPVICPEDSALLQSTFWGHVPPPIANKVLQPLTPPLNPWNQSKGTSLRCGVKPRGAEGTRKSRTGVWKCVRTRTNRSEEGHGWGAEGSVGHIPPAWNRAPCGRRSSVFGVQQTWV